MAEVAELLHLHLPLLPCLRTRLPRLVTFHSPLLADVAAIREPGLLPAMIKANARLFGQVYEHAQIKAAAAIIAVSGNVDAELRRHYRLGGRRPVVIPNGVDVDFFAPPDTGASPDPGAPPARPTVLYVGRLGYRKGLGRLVAAMARLKDRFDWRLAVAGEGPLEATLKAEAEVQGLAGRVDFLGFLEYAV